MAIAFVSGSFAQHEFAGSPSDRTLAYAQAVSAGSLLVAVIGTFTAGITLTVSDSVNGAWTQAGSYSVGTDTNSRISIWYFENSGAGTPTLTVAVSSTVYVSLALHEYTGCLTSGALRSTVTNTEAGSATTSATTGTCTATAGDLVVAGYCQGSALVISNTVASPFTIRADGIYGAVGEGLATADDVNAPGNEGATFTILPAVRWAAIAASFKPSAVTISPWWYYSSPTIGQGAGF